MAIPPKNPVRIVEMACVVLPNTRTSWRDQTTSYTRPATPDRRKIARMSRGWRTQFSGGGEFQGLARLNSRRDLGEASSDRGGSSGSESVVCYEGEYALIGPSNASGACP